MWVRAVAVNPVDAKARASATGAGPHILGWDASGVVEAVGGEVTLVAVDDEVHYVGNRIRPGSNAELQAVDERLGRRRC